MMRHGWQIGFLATLVLFGCAEKKKNEGAPRWTSFPVQIYTDPQLVPNAQAAEDFHDAMSFWERKVGKQLFDYQGNWSGQAMNGNSISRNTLFWQDPWSYDPSIAAQTVVISQKGEIQGAVVMVNPGTYFCAGDCQGQVGATSLRKVFAHELGHFIGLNHSSDKANIMYPDALPGAEIGGLAIDAQALLPLVN